jgi:tetratricopeptide (TPR) repeat protein
MQERLRREAQAMAQLAHPNVVAVHDVGVYEDRVFVAMEYVQGTTLAHWLAAAPRTQREILGAFIAAGRGLAAAHAAGLVHRDFKPENVMVGDDGRVRVGDFGLARPFDTRVARFAKPATDTPTDLTSTGVVVGTPLYMAPEQYLGDPADARTDQFSFCVALHGAIYGVRPFAGDTFTDLAAAVLGGKIEPTPKDVRVPGRVRDAIRRGLAQAPKDRWPSMDALLHELAAPRRRRVWLAPAATVLAAAAGIGLVATRSSGTPCDRDHLAGVWDAQRKANVERALSALDVPFAGATAAEVRQLGDRYAEQFLSARVGACEAHERGELKSDAYALESICFALRKRDLDAIVDRLERADARVAAHAVEALSNLMPVERCRDREMLRLLVGPPDAKTRIAINRVIGELHALRAALDLGDDSVQLGAIVKHGRAVDAPAVRAEVLELAGRYAAAVADFKNARHWLADAAADARSGHHDAAEASALAALLEVSHELRTDGADALVEDARRAGERVRDRPEIEIARLVGEAAIEADRNQIDNARRELDAAIAVADAQFPARDQRRGTPREAMIGMLVDAGRGADALPYADALVGLRKVVLGEDHPAFATAVMLGGDVQVALNQVGPAVDSYHRASAIANRARDPRVEAEALAHFAALHVRQGDTAAARALFARAIDLDATGYPHPHPAAVRHLIAAAALEAKLGNRVHARELYKRALTALVALYEAGDPRIAETEHALAD